MKAIIALAFVAVIGAASGSVSVGKCKDLFSRGEGTYGSATTEEVRVSECEDSPCSLKKGAETTIQFDFKPDKNYEKLTTSVFGGIGIIQIPFREVHGKNACKDIKRKRDGKKGCPLETGEVYTYSNSFPILKSYPSISVNVQYGLNDGKSPVVCFTMPAKITNA